MFNILLTPLEFHYVFTAQQELIDRTTALVITVLIILDTLFIFASNSLHFVYSELVVVGFAQLEVRICFVL